ncbi:MAG TPA: hypothetical protein VLI06_20435 [Solimonas sp.]|nr:hypothetical protein [Solimonas sp.]
MTTTCRSGTRASQARAWIAACLLVCLGLCWPAAGSAEAVAVLVAPDHAGQPINRALLRSIFTMRVRQWPDGRPLRVFVLADDHPLHDRFSRELLGTYPYVLRNAWDRAVYTGTGLAPSVVSSEDEMRRRVLATPGAIGYISGRGPDGRGEIREETN